MSEACATYSLAAVAMTFHVGSAREVPGRTGFAHLFEHLFFLDSENLGPGGPGDPIRLITLGYYAEQGGYAALILDTRTDAEVDGEWTLHLEEEERAEEDGGTDDLAQRAGVNHLDAGRIHM